MKEQNVFRDGKHQRHPVLRCIIFYPSKYCQRVVVVILDEADYTGWISKES